MTLNLYCKCGGGAEGEIDPNGMDAFKIAWYSVHAGEGHADCTREVAQYMADKEKR